MRNELRKGVSKGFYVAAGPNSVPRELRIAFGEATLKLFGIDISRDLAWWVKLGGPFTLSASQDFKVIGAACSALDQDGLPHDALVAFYPHENDGRRNTRLITSKGTKLRFPIPHDMPSGEDVAKWELVVSTYTPNGLVYIEVRFPNVSHVKLNNVGAVTTLKGL